MTYRDMTFCIDINCPSSGKCFRYWKNSGFDESSTSQMSMSDYSSVRNGEDKCENFLPVENRTQILKG